MKVPEHANPFFYYHYFYTRARMHLLFLRIPTPYSSHRHQPVILHLPAAEAGRPQVVLVR